MGWMLPLAVRFFLSMGWMQQVQFSFFLMTDVTFFFICFLDGDRWQLLSLLSLFSFSMKVQAPKAVEVDQRKRSAADPY